ncbi:MAG: PASTA domain-containing protein, partial [Pseudomonadota bacterium]
VDEGSAVDLVVSLGPNQVTVPDVVGETQADAATAITGVGLVVGTVTTANDASVPAGSVISQDPTGGTSVDEGSAVDLVVSLGPNQVTVPDVVGETQGDATTAITGVGLVVGTVTGANDPSVPVGSVISQDPIGGTTVDEGSAVDLVISLGPNQVVVPDVVGETQADATTAITGAGLVVGAVTTANDPTVPAGEVISQDPTGGTTVDEGSAVDLVVSLGPNQVTVPDVVGETQADATTAITGVGLVVGTVTGANDPSVPVGSVISQDPTGGTTVDEGSAVDLVISLGPNQVVVPDVVGETQADANTAITGVGLVVGAVTTANDASVPAGSVISQNPTGGTSVDDGSAVDLVISLGPNQVTVPDVVGETQADAATAITGVGLVVGAVTTANDASVPAGSVISQNPTGGTSVDEGSAVDLVISLGPGQVAVPDVIGLDQSSAESAIIGAGLVVGTVTTENDPTAPAGEVIDQDPDGGTLVDPGASVDLVISLGAANQPPAFDLPIDDQSVNEGELLEFTVSATDPDGDDVRFEGANLPVGASFVDNGDGTATFSWTPDFDQMGTFDVNFTVFDDQVPPGRDDVTVRVTVGDVNRPPEFIPRGDETRDVNEGEFLEIVLEADDVDGDFVSFPTPASLPSGAAFIDNGDGTATFSWTPAFGQTGVFPVLFTVEDDGSPILSDAKTITITVGDVNRPPVLDPIGNRSAEIGSRFELMVTASDPDGDPVSFDIDGLPSGADFTDNGDGTATLVWDPVPGPLGDTDPITITVSDDGTPVLTDDEVFVITVTPLRGDVDFDGDVDRDDVNLILAARNEPASGSDDPRDLDGDGVITVLDARIDITLCTRAGCATM